MFGFPDSSLSNALKAQMDAQMSFFSHLSIHAMESVQEIARLNAQASKAMCDRVFAGAGQYLGANSEMRPDQNQAVAEETQAGIAKIVDTVIPTPASESVAEEVPAKAPEIAHAAEQPNDVFEKVALQMSQLSERSLQGNSKKPAH